MENQENGLVLLCADGFLDMVLVLAQQFWVELDITWFVNTMNISETSSYGKVWRDWRKGLVDVENVLRLSIKGGVINILVVDAILLAAGDTNFLDDNVNQSSF
jgi:hypothetical protein